MFGLLTNLRTVQADDGQGNDDHQSDTPSDGRGNRTRQMPPRAPSGGAVVTGNGINYHNGSVLHSINYYYVWYGTWTQAQKDLLTHFGQNIGGSPYFAINTTYGDTTANVPNAVTLGPSYSFATNTLGTALSDAQILSLVNTAISSGQMGPADPNGLYMLLTGPGITATSGFLTQYCGWHSWGTSTSGAPIQYSFVGNATGPNLGSCAAQTSASPNGDPGVDAMISVMAHELEETATDPRGAGWYDSTGAENGDKCAWNFGTTYTANGALANMALGAAGNQKNYLIQQNWLNASGGKCALSYVTTPDFTATVSASQTVVPGGTSGNYTLTAAPTNGFTGTVNWTITPPSGIVATPTNPSGNSATFTLKAPADLAAGTYSIPITGVSGSLTHSVTATLVVSAPTFTLTVTPPTSKPVTRPSSGSTSTTFTVNVGSVGGFASPVTLSVSGGATGVTGSISPTSVTPGNTATLTVTVTSSARRTTRTFTVTGVSGSVSKTATASVTVQ